MTNNEEHIYCSFILKLLKASKRDEEDIHEFTLSSQECKDLFNAILEDK